MELVQNGTQAIFMMIRRVSAWIGGFARGVVKFFSSPDMFYEHGARILFKTIYRCKFSGFENIPEEGGAILIANHVSYMDGLLIHTAVKRPVTFIIDHDIYHVPAVKYFMDKKGAIPIATNKKSVEKALEQASQVLQSGGLVFIFPEGYLSKTGNMMRFRFGVEWIAQRNQADVIPIAIKGLWGSILSRKYWGKPYPWLPRSLRRKVYAVCGEPIPWQDATVQHLQREVMRLKDSVGD